MGDWDGDKFSFSAQSLANNNASNDISSIGEDRIKVRSKMREFIRNFRLGAIFPYRDQVRSLLRLDERIKLSIAKRNIIIHIQVLM